jgi:hypothetical protein
MWVFVVRLDEVCDFVYQFLDAAERATANGALRNDVEPHLLSLCNIPSATGYSRDPSIERCSQAS